MPRENAANGTGATGGAADAARAAAAPAPGQAGRSGLAGRTAMVVGASRGLGRGIAEALAAAGAEVVAISRGTAEYGGAPAGAGVGLSRGAAGYGGPSADAGGEGAGPSGGAGEYGEGTAGAHAGAAAVSHESAEHRRGIGEALTGAEGAGPSDGTGEYGGALAGAEGAGDFRGVPGADGEAVPGSRGAAADATGGGSVTVERADARDAAAAGSLLDRYDPDLLVLAAGASPLMRPLQHQTWETFSAAWETDVRMAFHWVREALLRPLRPGSRVVVISSGAALAGSPLSGGYAGAKATQRFLTGYARGEAERAGLGVTFTAVLPELTPLTDLGRPAVRAYAAREGVPVLEYIAGLGELLTPSAAGAALVHLAELPPTDVAVAYLLTAAGLKPLE
ncbi:SDR family oxidoreductase [Actinacidiphila guanduensis]|uniref:NAD(P)-dependent dehydrogenase, short-chain alcohol dehydrogenase family n=1 Tax=Actinacidiphila guanduensis TaxID=310781 RepID=A0A1H0K424_9ACTN|nr:SDR family oxidoreductase [Actinacidiphila guanduensis]SDO50421.1 NAD(P)-dependent dehydrogenase, short-chain alcohol dehydrogenase family [Actinacidiphila guanduensis]